MTLPVFIAGNNNGGNQNAASQAVTLTTAQQVGDLIVVYISFNNSTTVSSVTDTAGNTYHVACPGTVGGTSIQYLYYAFNVAAEAASANTVTVTLGGAAFNFTVTLGIYRNVLASSDPLQHNPGASASGNSAAPNSGTQAAAAGALVYSGTTAFGGSAAAGSGFTIRDSLSFWATEDQTLNAGSTLAGTFTAASGNWVTQMAIFKAASPPVSGTDTIFFSHVA